MAPDEHPAAARPEQRAQSGLQWAVRWHGVVVFLLLIGSVPLVHLAWHWIAGMDEPIVLTRNQKPRPPLSWSRTRPGQWQWALDLEQHLQEASPIVWWLRGNYNELRYLLGLYASDSVAVGRDGWMFLPQSLHPDEDALRRSAVKRAQFLARLHARPSLELAPGPIRYALALHPPARVPESLNGFGLWNALVLVLMLAAYGWPIAQFIIQPSPGAIVHRVGGGG